MISSFLQKKDMHAQMALVAAFAIAFAAALVFFVSARCAFAEENDVYAQADAAQQQLEQSASAYAQAQQDLEQIEAEIAENEQRIDELSVQIPIQQEKSNDAMRALYKMQQESGSLVTLLLSSENFNELLLNIDYISAFYGSKMREITNLLTMKSELDSTASSLSEKRAQAASDAEAAEQALAQAQTLREQAQAAADAARKAEEEEAAAAAAAAAEEAASKDEEEAASSDPSQGGNLTNGEVAADPGSDDVDWSVEKSEFVNAWAGRIDAYLSGSPLSGQGATFASAAWDYGIDPRFSPAIACVESSKGAYCFRSHNAWGWGSSSWDSWEAAIDAHVRGLARGYGYTVTVDGAKKYCPPNWEFWYSRVCAEMAKI